MRTKISWQPLLAVLVIAVMAVSCKGSDKPLLPNISGKAGEVIVVMDKDNWDGNLGSVTRDLLTADYPFLPQREPLFSVVNVPPTGFADLFKIHRNILIYNVSADVRKAGVIYRNDQWAYPQCVIQISAPSADSAAGGAPHFPTGYRVRKKTDDFIWISDDKQYTTQGVFVYKYPASENENFTEQNIIAHRNKFLKENVPGMFDNTYMITNEIAAPETKFVRFRGRQFAETRGLWEVFCDFMGGPFVSHSFYSRDGKDIIVLDGFVYAPKYDKRQYLRQVEAILYSFEWPDDEVEAKEK